MIDYINALFQMLLLCMWIPVLFIDNIHTQFISRYLISLNGCFIAKLIQWYASVHDDGRYKFIFEDLQTHGIKHTEEQFLNDFGYSLYDRFIVNTTPLASGTIGQVYEAYDEHSNKVIIKVKHPGIDRKTEIQMNIILWFIDCYLRVFKKVPYILRALDVDGFVDSFKNQLSFMNEAKSLEKYRTNFKNVKGIHFPKPLQYTENIIIMEYVKGKPYHELSFLEQCHVSERMLMYSRHMSLIHGYMHCDLHVGNWKYDSESDTIHIYDPGFSVIFDNEKIYEIMLKSLTEDVREATRDLIQLGTDADGTIIEHFLERYPQYIETAAKKSNTSIWLDGLLTFIKDHEEYKIKHEFMSLLVSALIIENIFYSYKCTGISKEDLKLVCIDQFAMCKEYNGDQIYCNWLECIIYHYGNLMNYDTSSVEAFYNT